MDKTMRGSHPSDLPTPAPDTTTDVQDALDRGPQPPPTPQTLGSCTMQDGYLSSVLKTSAAASKAQNVVQINMEVLDALVAGGGIGGALSLEKIKRAVTRVPLPLKFDDHSQEINFHCILALLSFGGWFGPELVRRTDSSVEDAVKFGLIGAHLSRTRMDATWMKNSTVGDISEGFKIPVREPTETSIPGVTVEKPGPLAAFAQTLCSVLNATGERLLSMGYEDIAQFVMHTARADPGAEGMVRSLCGAFPAFQDIETLALTHQEGHSQAGKGGGGGGGNSMDVTMLKNAQLLVGELSARMGPKGLDALKFNDTDKLTAVADADLITTLITLGVIEPVGDKKVSFSPSNTAALRAVAVQACHIMSQALGDDYRPHELSLYLRRLGKKKEYESVPRFVPHSSQSI